MKNNTVVLLAVAFVAIVVIGLAAANAISGNSSMKVYDAQNNGQTITVKSGETVKIALDENPTTGFSWINTTTPGLTIVSDKYIAPSSGLVGAGGVHEWEVRATGTGDQQFSGIYKRPWEPTFGNETAFGLNIKIT